MTVNLKRKNASDALRQMSSDLSSSTSDPYYTPHKEDLECARYYHTLATKNDKGTLTAEEAQEIYELLGEENSIPTFKDSDCECWIEIGTSGERPE